MTFHINRRRLLGAGAAASLAVVGQPLLSAPASAAVRRDVGGLAAGDPILAGYRTAIAAMKALPDTDPTSWVYQAAIHGSVLGPAHPAWATCEHGTYFFWSWHRMYLYWFERIVRSKSGVYNWTLPYWDWTQVAQRPIPAPFRDPASQLYTANRNAAMNAGAVLSAGTVSTGGLALVPFNAASSSLEGTPHGSVHVGVGGGMSSFSAAGLDPIFWLHHCQVDRLWNLWIAQGGGRTNPLSDAPWKTTQFTFFKEDGSQVKMTGCQVLRASQQLSYTYENEPAQVNQTCLKLILVAKLRLVLFKIPLPKPWVLAAEPLRLPLIRREDLELRKRALTIAQNPRETLLLELKGVEADRQPGIIWEVYVGLPPNAPPQPESPHYVGNIALFSTGIRSEKHHNYKPAEFVFPLDRAVAASAEGALDVTFVPSTGFVTRGRAPKPQPQAPVRIGEATLTVETDDRR